MSTDTATSTSPSVCTCGRCVFYESFHGMTKGLCHGLPPTPFPSGGVCSPEVKAERRSCSLFQALPEGTAPAVRTKVDPDTPGDAAKAARLKRR